MMLIITFDSFDGGKELSNDRHFTPDCSPKMKSDNLLLFNRAIILLLVKIYSM